MEIPTQITEKQAKKLAIIHEKTQQSLEQILDYALDYYYSKVLNADNNHLEKFSRIGFIGCIEAEPNLAKNCESIFH